MNLRVLVVGALATLLVAVGATALPVAPAAATHPCASGPSGTYDPNPGADHDACTGSIRPASPQGTEVVLVESDDGATVTLALGQRLRVELGGNSGRWASISAGSALHRFAFDIRYDRTVARFTALSPTAGQQVLAAATDRQWSVTVVVEDRQDAGSTSSPQPCQSVPTPSPSPGVVLLEQQDNGRTVQVERGRLVDVRFYGCDGDPDLQAPIASSALRVTSAHATNPGGATALFTAAATGTATISAAGDAPCLHAPTPCALPQQAWQVTVEVVEPRPCELAGPVLNAVLPGETVTLHGRVDPHEAVTVWFHELGTQGWSARRWLTADADGRFATSYLGVDDQRWYATSGECTTAVGLTRIQPTVSGPRYVRRSTRVPIVVRGPARQPVQLYARRAGGEFRLVRTARLDSTGTYRTSYLGDVDHRYYARTGPDGRRTFYGLTQVR